MKSIDPIADEVISPTAMLVFAGFRLDCRSRRLWAPDGAEVAVSARVFDTLRCLASHPHELLTRQRLMREIWPGTIVDGNNLDQQISAARKVLGDVGGREFVVTVKGQGFRFVQDVAQVSERAEQQVEATSVQSSALNPRLRFAAWLGGAVAVAAVALGAMFWFRADPARPQRTNVDYLAARALIRKSGSTQIRTAIDLLEKVVQRDPGFAPAWASLAEGYTLAADFPPALALPLSPVELQKHVATAALHAFELAPDAPETLRSAGMISMQNHDWSEAEQRLQRALQLAGPGDYEANLEYAWFLMNVGRVREATPYEERAMRIEPSLMRPVALRAALYEMNGDLNAAESLLLANGNLQENDPLRRQGLFMVRMARHDQCGVPGKPAADGLPCPLLADPQGALSQARTSYENAVASGNAGQLFALAHFAAFLGDRKLALDMLDLWSNGSTQNLHIVWRPVMREVREMPGFVELVRKVGLVDYWRTTGHWGDFCRPVGASSVSCSTPQFATNEPKTTERASPPGFTLARGFPAM